MARPRPHPDDLLSTPGRAWVALASLGVSVAAGTLYVAGWRGLLVRFLGDVRLAALVTASVAVMSAGLGAAAAWRILWRGVIRVPESGSASSRGRRSAAHRPPLLSFGLVNLAAGLAMVVLLLMRDVLVVEFEEWVRSHLLPAAVALAVRSLLVVIAVGPPLACVGFGGGILLHGWGRPRLGTNETNWYHGLELPTALLSGVGLGLVAAVVMTSLRTRYTDWVLLSALAVLVVSGAAVAVGERLSPPEAVPRHRPPAAVHGRYRWRRFRVITFVVGLLLGVFLVSTEVVRRRAACVTAPGPLSDALATGSAVILMGMIVRRLVRGETRRARSEAGYALLAAGCAGLGALAWLGWVGHVRLSAPGAGGPAQALTLVAGAVPLLGVGWMASLGITTSGSVGNRHARTAAGSGPLAFGAGLGTLIAGGIIVPAMGAEVGAVGAVLAMVLAGSVVLATTHDHPAPVRMSVGAIGVLVAGTLLGVIRQSGAYDRSCAAPRWSRCAVSLWGEVTEHGARTPRLNGVPLAGTEEPLTAAEARGLAPRMLHGDPQRVLVHVTGDPRMLKGVIGSPDGSVGRPRRLVAYSEQIPGVCRSVGWPMGAGAATGDQAMPRARPVGPGLPEHLATTDVRYDLAVVDLRGGGTSDLTRLACRETVTCLVRHLDDGGQAWLWVPIERLTQTGMYALLATVMDAGDVYSGVWLWEEPAGQAVLCALIVSREPLGAVAADALARADRRGRIGIFRRLMVVDVGRWPRDVAAEAITADRPAGPVLHALGRTPEQVKRTLAENVGVLRSLCRPVGRNETSP